MTPEQTLRVVAEALGVALDINEPGYYQFGKFGLMTPEHPDSAGAYIVDETIVIRGVWRTANGDGWPDEADVKDVGAYETLMEAINALAKAYIEHQVSVAIENAELDEDYRLMVEETNAAHG